FRILLEEPEPSLNIALERLNSLLYKNIQGRLEDTRNMTLSLLRHENGHIDICGQHEKVILVRHDGTLEIHDTANLGIYVGLMEDISYTINLLSLTLNKGDQILLFTDGATEAENASKEQFSEKRLATAFKKYAHQSTQEIVESLKAEILAWQGDVPLMDDITLVVVRRT
ncbi:MAG TPA: SpoIIE family protein phosphatase, partial [Turneriella sp.]|nr:SpoIIE family protein phosphatase [Turneriella sp.]